MREIRFRAWHKLAKRMVFVDMLDFVLDAYRAHAGTSSGSGHLCDIELMQYTGLKDKAGKEVYEGDIVKATLDDRFEARSEVTEEVQILDGFLSPFYMRVECEEEWWKDRLVDGFEVIGNRYDNPDLLKTRRKPTKKCHGIIAPIIQFDTIIGYTCCECGASCGTDPDEELVHREVSHE